ncbi:MAG: glyoxalase [Micrococcaceae bacterium]
MTASAEHPAPGIRPNETVVPLLTCLDEDATVEFFTALGFEKTWDQRRPYLYLAFRFSAFELHYGHGAPDLDPAAEQTGGCLVMVDDVAAYHAGFVAGLRAHYGKVLARGLPRITRYRPGASRFSVVDPNGNVIIVIQRDEPSELEYGGSAELTGLAKAIDNARILREFKTDDLAASRALKSGLKRHSETATVTERAVALAALIELSVALDDPAAAHQRGEELRGLPLDDAARAAARAAVAEPGLVEPYLKAVQAPEDDIRT